MSRFYADVARRAGHRCEYCRAPEIVFGAVFEVEHIVPVCDGGGDDLSNFALACRACNGSKSTARVAVDDETGALVPLFNPRTDAWHEHFRYEPESGTVVGLTPAGRATVARLDLNDPRRLIARGYWEALKLFP